MPELVIERDDAWYPQVLREIHRPPTRLWTRGMVDTLGRPSVAVVGARAASPTGQRIGYELGRDLALAGLVVVSGLALGVDGAAHAGALDAGGLTVAVLGCGVDIVYPRQHKALAARVAAQGVIVSEFAPGTEPRPSHFPQRNRIISGLSLAVVVVEAGEHSGSLITAHMALDQGRDVLAVPGNVASGSYRGSHGLIKDGARLVETVKDVLEEINWRPAGATPRATARRRGQLSDLEDTMMSGEPYTVEELAERLGRSAAEVLAELSALEIDGRVTRMAGGNFVRLD